MGQHGIRLQDDRTDVDLIRSARHGDPEAFEVLYYRHLASFEGHIRRRGLSAAEAKSVFGDCLLRCIHGFDTGRQDGSFVRYLSKAVRNSVLSEHRSTHRRFKRLTALTAVVEHERHHDRRAGPEDLAADECNRIIEAMDLLSPVQRAVITRLALDGAAVDVVAEEIGATRKQVDNLYQQAKRELGRHLPPEMWDGRSHRHKRHMTE